MTSGARSSCCCTGATTRTSRPNDFPRKVRFLGVSELQLRSRHRDAVDAAVRASTRRARAFPRAGDSYDKPGKPNCLVVVLVRAKKLKRLEKYAETPGTTDPTCLLTLDGEKKRSRTVENQLNPHGLSAC